MRASRLVGTLFLILVLVLSLPLTTAHASCACSASSGCGTSCVVSGGDCRYQCVCIGDNEAACCTIVLLDRTVTECNFCPEIQ